MYWGSAGFNYTVQYRRKTAKDVTESRWDLGKAVHVRIYDGNNDSIVIPNPGYRNEWEFRIRSNNHYGSSEAWTTNTSFSGQDSKWSTRTLCTCKNGLPLVKCCTYNDYGDDDGG